MNELIKQLYSGYGTYINQFRSFPSILDGAKLVERRIFYSLYEVAKDKYTKSAKIVGHCLGNYHPHSDLSVYQSLVNLVNNGFVSGQGNFGIDVGVREEPPAAMRYTEVKLSPYMQRLAFENIKHVPFAEVELEKEPLLLPTLLPLCLIGTKYCQGMGFGYATKIPAYKQEDLIRRLKWLLDKQGQEPIIRPITDCEYVSDDAVFRQLLRTGKACIQMKGKCRVDGDSVYVYSIPPSRTFAGILKKFKSKIEDEKCLGWQDDSKTTTCVKFKVLRPRTYAISDFVSELRDNLNGSVSFECNVCDQNGKVKTIGIDTYLLFVYRMYKAIMKKVFETYIRENENKIQELILIEKIKPLLRECLKITPDNVDSAIGFIVEKLNCDLEEVKHIFSNYTIGRLFKVKTDISKFEDENKEYKKNLDQIDTYIWTEKYQKL